MTSAFLECLVPSINKIKHDHCYSRLSTEKETPSLTDQPQQFEKETETIPVYNVNHEATCKCALVKASFDLHMYLVLSKKRLNKNTQQSSNQEWFKVRSKRFTGLKCGRILSQKKKSVSLLREYLYPKLLDPLPKPIAWGKHYESIAIEKYNSHVKALGKNVLVSKCTCSFIVHPEKGWIGASPDGFVKDNSCEQPDGLLEIKMSLLETRRDAVGSLQRC